MTNTVWVNIYRFDKGGPLPGREFEGMTHFRTKAEADAVAAAEIARDQRTVLVRQEERVIVEPAA